jgi:hypothetical protein
MIKVYINGVFAYMANYCKSPEGAVEELKRTKTMKIYQSGTGDYKIISITDKDIITAERC